MVYVYGPNMYRILEFKLITKSLSFRLFETLLPPLTFFSFSAKPIVPENSSDIPLKTTIFF